MHPHRSSHLGGKRVEGEPKAQESGAETSSPSTYRVKERALPPCYAEKGGRRTTGLRGPTSGRQEREEVPEGLFQAEKKARAAW